MSESPDPLAGLRRQYHLMPDDDGRKAWDVHRLIELSAELPIEQVPLADIGEVDTVYWFDADHHRPTVRAVIEHAQLISDTDLSYPIILGEDGRVMDGMHRVCKALIEERSTIAARRFPVDPEPDHRNCHPADLDYSER
ncbi:MAG: hypothetical protein AAF548_02215 [Actinomycetota bacterium]